MSKFPQYWKAAIAFVAPAASVIAMSALLPASDGGSTITKTEWIMALAAAVITSASVAAKGNADKPEDGA